MAPQAGEPIRVLVADDHPLVREGLRAVLPAGEFEIIGEAGSGKEAVAAVQTLEPDVV